MVRIRPVCIYSGEKCIVDCEGQDLARLHEKTEEKLVQVSKGLEKTGDEITDLVNFIAHPDFRRLADSQIGFYENGISKYKLAVEGLIKIPNEE